MDGNTHDFKTFRGITQRDAKIFCKIEKPARGIVLRFKVNFTSVVAKGPYPGATDRFRQPYRPERPIRISPCRYGTAGKTMDKNDALNVKI